MQYIKIKRRTNLKKTVATLLAVIVLLCTLVLGITACNKDNGNVIRLNEVTHSLFYTPQYLALSLDRKSVV